MIISTNKLYSILNDSNVLIIDTRSFNDYHKYHIPGAVNLDIFAFHWIDTTLVGIKNFNRQTEMILSFVGVLPEKNVIFYDDISGMLAARGVWLLNYFLHSNVYMLDGGIKKWKNEDLPIETKPNSFKPTKFSAGTNPKVIAGYEYILDNIDTLKIIDARSEQEYNGTIPRAAQAGHIPNSVNIDWSLNIDNDGTFKQNSELTKIYDISKDSEIVTYCQGAYRAANSFVALKNLGFENVRVYLGSWGEWGNKLDLPTIK